MNPTYRCANCNQPMRNFGRVRRVVAGVAVWFGRCCAFVKVKVTA